MIKLTSDAHRWRPQTPSFLSARRLKRCSRRQRRHALQHTWQTRPPESRCALYQQRHAYPSQQASTSDCRAEPCTCGWPQCRLSAHSAGCASERPAVGMPPSSVHTNCFIQQAKAAGKGGQAGGKELRSGPAGMASRDHEPGAQLWVCDLAGVGPVDRRWRRRSSGRRTSGSWRWRGCGRHRRRSWTGAPRWTSCAPEGAAPNAPLCCPCRVSGQLDFAALSNCYGEACAVALISSECAMRHEAALRWIHKCIQ